MRKKFIVLTFALISLSSIGCHKYPIYQHPINSSSAKWYLVDFSWETLDGPYGTLDRCQSFLRLYSRTKEFHGLQCVLR